MPLSYIRVTWIRVWHESICDMNPSYMPVCHTHERGMSHIWHDMPLSHICVTWILHMFDMHHWYVFIRMCVLIRIICMRDVTQYVFIRIIRTCDVCVHSYVWAHSYVCAHSYHSNVWRDALCVHSHHSYVWRECSFVSFRIIRPPDPLNDLYSLTRKQIPEKYFTYRSVQTFKILLERFYTTISDSPHKIMRYCLYYST